MYKLAFTTVKKGNRLTLYNGGKYIVSITRKNKNKDELIEILKSKVDLDINWGELIYNKCLWCGKKFKKNRNNKYCSDNCKAEAVRNQKRLKAWEYRNNKKKYFKKVKYEYLNNKGFFPKGFNQIDTPNNIGESKLNGKPNKNKKREYELIQKELERIGLR